MKTLDQLTADQRDQLYDLLIDLPTKEVVERIAQPAPEGFGIKTHITTLRRFKNRYWAELAADREESALARLSLLSFLQHYSEERIPLPTRGNSHHLHST